MTSLDTVLSLHNITSIQTLPQQVPSTILYCSVLCSQNRLGSKEEGDSALLPEFGLVKLLQYLVFTTSILNICIRYIDR